MDPSESSEDVISWTLHVPVSGDYRVSGRQFGHGGGANSYFVRVDDGPWEVLDTGYSWKFEGGMRSVVLQDVSAGEHTFSITIREDGTEIDKLYVRSVSERLPELEGLGPESLDLDTLEPPGPCQNVMREQTDDDHTTLEWEYEGSDSSGFVIERREPDGDDWIRDFVGPDARTWRSRAPRDSETNWRVRAWNAAGTSEPTTATRSDQ